MKKDRILHALAIAACCAMMVLPTAELKAQKGVLKDALVTDTISYNLLKIKRDQTNRRIQAFLLGDKPYTGVVKQSWPDNKVAYYFNVKNGRAFLQNVYYENGQTERRLEMKDGLEHGSFRMYFPDGKPYVEQFYNEGVPVGVWKRWDANGNLVEIINQDKK